MDDTRSSTPEPPQDLWSSILDSVSSTHSTPSKSIVLLGQPGSGKSSLAAALLQKAASDRDKEDTKSDYALGYDFADVRDDADEDTLARLSVYTIPSTAPSFTALLPHFLPPRTCIPQTLVMIALDWTKPWTFLEELQAWLKWAEKWTKGDGSREVEITREESRDRLQYLLQHYSDPTTEPVSATSPLPGTLLPLGPGTLTHNRSGIPIIVVCTKADLIDEDNDLVAGASGMGSMVKGKGGEWEERTDGVMQVLRTICLKYGAALFYTTPLPATLRVLRQYALHVLFAPPAPSPGSLAADGAAPVRNPFPFHHKPNTLDRDQIVIPAGWDSWGKISVMRDGFDAKVWGEAWEHDLEAVEGPGQISAKKLYSALVPDQGPKPHPLPSISNPTPEQAFLAKHYDENSKREQEPRAMKSPIEAVGATAAGIVGPLGSTSFNLPTVERALTDMEAGSGGGQAGGSDPRRRPSGRPPSSGLAGIAPTISATSSLGSGRTGTSPTVSGGGPSPTATQTQHEVLQNFFQSLLSSKDRGGAATAASRPRTDGAGGGTEDATNQ